MYIYLDESGSFVVPSQPHKISAVAALVIPEAQHDALIADFQQLEQSWHAATEPKGNKLDEAQISAVIRLLARFDVLLDVAAIDMALQPDSETSQFKAEQAARVVKHVDARTPPQLATVLRALNAAILDISNQLFIQAFLTILLVERILANATLFHVLRDPGELSRFIWVIDGKDIGGSKYERLWRTLILPLTQSRSAKKPLATLEGGD